MTKEQEGKIMVMTYSQVKGLLRAMCVAPYDIDKDDEFTSAALGSNETTTIKGATDAGTVGGHKDTADRRMISAIGCEEMCGYLAQWTETIGGYTGNSWGNRDGKGSFGQEYGDPYVLLAGGRWLDSAYCGSRSRDSNTVRSTTYGNFGGRGSSRVSRGW